MRGLDTQVPRLTDQPPSVDFIHHRLPRHHEAFSDLSVHYDPTVGCFVPNEQEAAGMEPSPSEPTAIPLSEPGILQGRDMAHHDKLPNRPVHEGFGSMVLWNQIFPEVMETFKRTTKEPKDRSRTEYDIRTDQTWEAVYGKLQKAQLKYDGEAEKGGWFRRKRRSAAGKAPVVSEVLSNVSSLVPNNEYATPVIGVVSLMLNAVKKGAEVREQVFDSMDGLLSVFSDMETFLSIFRDDVNIRKAAVDLAVATLVGIENAIGFLTSKEVVRGVKAVGLGSFYEHELVESLETINKKAERLLQEAYKSNMVESHFWSQHTRDVLQKMYSLQQQMAKSQAAQKKEASLLNSAMELFDSHIKTRDHQLATLEKDYRRERERNIFLVVEINRLRSSSPGLANPWGPYAPPPPPAPPALEWGCTQYQLRQLLGIGDVEVDDMSFVASKSPELPARQCTRAEQIVSNPLFRSWVTSPGSAKLLIHWDGKLPKQVANISPLSLFCVSLVQMLQGHPRFIPIVWICGRHVNQLTGPTGGSAMLASLIDQLLRQHEFDVRTVISDGVVDPNALESGSEQELVKLLLFLVAQVPETITLVFVVDNVALYERDSLRAKSALMILVRLVAEGSLSAAVKVLFTSTPGTTEIRWAFEDERLILNVDTLPQLVWSPSQERVARELGESFRGPADE
ncbi:hypothetical protein C8035_v005927 [Colletotrichum spinosum]|uniref:Uncharacterized protein n=1 Tax=Colletotrichum spinosum TaxID=1347390 RepID=A0A4V3HRG1_9PEZI|nr:hypothetical protein C8035_v005927 [Colletotrichum spinosum]